MNNYWYRFGGILLLAFILAWILNLIPMRAAAEHGKGGWTYPSQNLDCIIYCTEDNDCNYCDDRGCTLMYCGPIKCTKGIEVCGTVVDLTEEKEDE